MDLTPEDPRTPQQSAQCPSAVTAEAETQVTAAELVMTRRRSLLKAAASVAPVLATLPNGAALANASAFQCANNQLDEANVGLPDGAIAGTPSSGTPGVGTDQYYRVAGKRWNLGSPNNPNNPFYNFTAFDGVNVTVTSTGRRISYHPHRGWFDEGPQRGPCGHERA